MPNILDVFSGDAFSVQELTDSINLYPVQYGLINSMGLFQDKGVTTTSVAVEIKQNVLNLISSQSRGLTAQKNVRGKREMRHLAIPHYKVDDQLLPSDLQDVRAFGSADQAKTVQTEIADILESLSRKHDITAEYLKAGAISGKILDADGSTLLDIFGEFGVTESKVNFALGVDTTKLAEKTAEVMGTIEDNLDGDTMDGVVALCSPEFFKALINHKKIAEAYQNYKNSANDVLNILSALNSGAGGPGLSTNADKMAEPLRRDVRKGFMYQDILWVEYRGKATYMDENGETHVRPFIEPNTCRFLPTGTRDTFRNYYAPADWIETVNTVGIPKYSKVVPEQGGRYVEVLSESNPLPLCIRPKILVKGGIASGDL